MSTDPVVTLVRPATKERVFVGGPGPQPFGLGTVHAIMLRNDQVHHIRVHLDSGPYLFVPPSWIADATNIAVLVSAAEAARLS